MQILVNVEKVHGGLDIHVLPAKADPATAQRAIGSTPRQAGLRAGELVRTLIEHEFEHHHEGKK